MDPAVKTLKAAQEAIRDIAANALNQVGHSQGERSMRWKCKACQYVKHFTKPVPWEATGRCPRCKSTEFRPVL
jgi:predicted Zn-ribbon and HTH transcriptional regulator